MTEMKADIIIIGGSLGGTLAAFSAAKSGKKVILTEETDWLGGQLTSQAVPPDEHPWIEQFGCTQTYREFRNRVREYYRKNYPLKQEEKENPVLNPGNAWVSRLSHEPKVALSILNEMLSPYVNSGRISVIYSAVPVGAEVENDAIQSVAVEKTVTGERILLKGPFFIDATECGDLLPLTGAEYVTGAESRAETGEEHAGEVSRPQDMQSFTFVFALEHIEGKDFTIEKPAQYEFWKEYQAPFLKHKQLSWFIPDAHTGSSKKFAMFSHEDSWGLWDYRRIVDQSYYKDLYEGDISLINWPQNDYWLGSIIDVDADEKEKHLYQSKQLGYSLLYWLQTEAPRSDGGKGYPGLRLRGDVLGTDDGFAKYPYIRESRRIKAVHTVVEEDINANLRDSIKKVKDSVGIGCYRIDLHPTIETNTFFYAESFPFEIPLGSLIPVRLQNLLPACKNIGTTHLTNGCFRVHPVEWNIGESAGYLAAFAGDHNVTPKDVLEQEELLRSYQSMLEKNGIVLHWPEIGAV
ncbi:FAD-dependent oxidoreductase [Metabacillus indicus]|uniref:FAD-dependent oxidoreductase n=1 Tax=Metabacillus indicus TaxID=246786 RepID=UPI002A035835|nr:FAD-dependent oxidoreductase [Metabacillus indicus]MDX8288993.1 FAD-dependent oxidoreductase [Metabacillus indicus]